MKFSTFAVWASAIFSTAAQDRADFLPKCALQCLDDATKRVTDCDLDSAVCWCIQSNYEAIYDAGVTCVLDSCGPDKALRKSHPICLHPHWQGGVESTLVTLFVALDHSNLPLTYPIIKQWRSFPVLVGFATLRQLPQKLQQLLPRPWPRAPRRLRTAQLISQPQLPLLVRLSSQLLLRQERPPALAQLPVPHCCSLESWQSCKRLLSAFPTPSSVRQLSRLSTM